MMMVMMRAHGYGGSGVRDSFQYAIMLHSFSFNASLTIQQLHQGRSERVIQFLLVVRDKKRWEMAKYTCHFHVWF